MKRIVLALLLLCMSITTSAQTVSDYYLENLSTTDTYLRSSLPNNSFGTEQNLITGGWGDTYVSLIKFNISGLPSITTGNRVSLWFYNANPGGSAQPTAVYIAPLATNFSDTTTWNQGASYYNSPSYLFRQVNVNPYDYWTEFNITDYYELWKQSVIPNYGVVLMPLNNNNHFNYFKSSSTSVPSNQKPILRIFKPLKLKWPLSTSYSSRQINQYFGEDWAGGTTCSATGVIKKHNGTDYAATAGNPVYAAEAGVVKAVFSQSPWGSVVTIEHTRVDSSKFTTNYWHTNPSVSVGNTVAKGYQIATIANLGGNTHFHFGIRDGAHFVNSSGKDVSSAGALPQTNCDGWPAFPENFIDSESGWVYFQ